VILPIVASIIITATKTEVIIFLVFLILKDKKLVPTDKEKKKILEH